MTTATKPPPQKPDPNRWPDWQDDSANRRDLKLTVSVGIVVTILFHAAMILVVPWDSFLEPPQRDIEEPPPPLQLEFVEYEMPKFIEANPNVAPERPKETNNISAQDQVAAQENPDPNDNSDKPQVDGELKDSHKIVDGAIVEETPPPMPEGQQMPEQQAQPMQQPSEPVVEQQQEPVEEQPPAEMTEPTPPAEQTQVEETPEPEVKLQEAAPEALEQETDQEQGELSLEKPGEEKLKDEIPEEPVEKQETPKPIEAPEKPVEEPVEQTQPQPKEQPKVMMEEVVPQQQVQSGSPSPQARPRINFRVPAGPLMQQGRSANRMGQVAVDANFSEFGAYQQRMVEAISAQWNLLGQQARYTGADIGTNCVVEFTLTREGTIKDLTVRYSSSSHAGTLMTMEAIKSRAPYGPWTQDMVKVLGEEQTIRINFFYR